MTAIITGSGLGLFNTSADLLGGTGNSLVGRAGQSDAVYVNGTTGNLVIRAQDEFVSTAGLDTNLVRVYNSQGLLSDDNGDNWQFDFLSSLSAVTGTLNAVGSTITRKSGDGSTALYTCKTAGGPYISTDGSGADDTLAWNAGSSTWTRTDGDTRQQETFNASGVLLTALDRDGNVTTYNRTGTKVTSIVTGSGADTQTVYIDYNATNTNNIDAIRVVQGTTGGGTTQTLTRYYYDSQQRLSQVVVDLTPTTAATLQDANADGYWDTVNGQTYATRYTYETATNRRVASITQGDGSKISFTYDASGRVASYTDGENKLTTMSYASVAQTVPVSATVTATTTAPPAAWGAAALRESSGVGAWYARTAFAANGNGMAVWVQDPDLMVSYYTRATDSWSTPAAIDGAVTGNASAPSLTMSANGTALLTWVQNSNIYARRYVGGVWDNTSVTPLESLAGAALNPVGAINDSGRATIAFVQTDGTRNNLYVSNYTGSAWSAPAAIDDQGGANNNAIASTMAPSVSVDASGNAALAWLQKVGAEANDSLYYARYDALANSWSNPDAAALESTTAAVTAAQLSLDGNGDGVAVFVQGGALYARTYTLASNSWGAASTLAASGVTGAPSLAMSANGQAAVGWLNGGNAFVAIYAGGAWGAGTAVENLAGAAINQSVAINDSGQAAVLIVQSNGTANHVYANRYVNGAWSAGATALESNTNAMSTTAVPLASLDKLGNLTVLWGQKAASGDSGESIYSARYNNDTTPYYTTVSADTTWATIAQNVYGDSTAATALQAALGGIAVPAVGTKLRVPPRLDYTKSLTLNKVDITDALAQVTTFVSDASGRLVQVLSPTVGGVRLATSYVYDTAGNVVEVIDGNGNVVTSTYDTADNLLTRRDALGNTVAYTYSSANQVLTQTLYTVADPDGAGAGQPGGAMTTRYVYDAENHLRFSISAEGRVTESAYNANGTLATQVAYTANLYTTAGTPTETNMAAWVTAITDRTKAERVDYVYDFRGNISKTTAWLSVDAAGAGVNDGWQRVTQYVYDQRGLLLQTVSAYNPFGTPNPADPSVYNATTYTYDGMGRRLTGTQWISTTELRTVLTTSYDDVGNKAVVTLANNLATTSVYDRRGLLLSISQASGATALGTTSYQYDADGQLRIVTDPLGNKTHTLYDAAGRTVATIDATGAMVETVYDNGGNVIQQIAYATRPTSTQLATLTDGSGNPLNPTLASMRPVLDASNDRVTRSVYDAAGRLVMEINLSDTSNTQGLLTQYFYDGAGRLTDTVQYANAISLAGLPAVPTPASVFSRIVVSGADRHERSFYDQDGKLVGTMDGEGYLTESQYNAAGELVHTIGYANAALASLRDTASFAQLKANAGTSANDQHGYFFYNGAGQLAAVLDAENYLTVYSYTMEGQEMARIRYYNKANTYTGTQTWSQLVPATHANDARTTKGYNGAGELTSVTEWPAGTTTAYAYNNVGQLIRSDRAAFTAEVRTEQVRYDAQGQVLQQLTGNGSVALAALGASPTQAQIDAVWNQYSVTNAYDQDGRRVSATDPYGNKTVYYYDEAGRLRFSIDAMGQVSEQRYNAFGEVTETFAYAGTINPAGLTGGTYNAGVAGQIFSGGLANAAKDGHSTVNYTLRGAVKSALDAMSKSITYTYNAFGEVASETDPVGTGLTTLTNFSYDHRGLQVKEVDDADNGAYTGIKRTSSTVYDAFGRLVQATDPNGNQRSLGYDKLGRQLTITTPSGTSTLTYDALGRTLTQKDALNNTVATYVYDDTNRKFTLTTAENVVMTTTFNRHGETLTVADGNGGTTTYSYDADGNLTNTARPVGYGGVANSAAYYDRADRLYRTTDANGVTTLYTFDAASRVLTATVDPTTIVTPNDNPTGLNLSTRYGYDGRGQVLTVTDARGTVTSTTYDSRGLVSQMAIDPAGLNLVTAFSYDDAGRTVSVTTGYGTAAASTTSYVYDRLGRRTETHADPAGLNLITQYAYDADGNVTAVTDPLGNVSRYYYDGDDRQVYSLSALNELVQTVYDADGQVVKRVAYAASLTGGAFPASPTVPTKADIAARVAVIASAAVDHVEQYVYDKDGRLVYDFNGLGEVTQNSYDGNGNVVKAVHYAGRIPPATAATVSALQAAVAALPAASHASDLVINSVYDGSNRLFYRFDALGDLTQYYYDLNNNLTQVTQYTVPINPATVASLGAFTIPGVVTASSNDLTTRSVYDRANRLAYSVDGLGDVTGFTYDAAGNITKTTHYATRIPTSTAPSISAIATALGAASPLDSAQYAVYDAAGRMVYSFNAAGELSKIVYDADGNVIQSIAYATRITVPANGVPPTLASMPAVTTDSALDQSSYGVFDAANRMVYSFNGAGEVTQNTYDADGRVVKSTHYARRITIPGTITAANVAAAITADATFDQTRYVVYDADSRVVYSFNAAGEVTLNSYDGVGNLTRQLRYANRIAIPGTVNAANVAAAISASTANDQFDTNVYDAAGRLVYSFNALGELSKSVYDANGALIQGTRYYNRINPATAATVAAITTAGVITLSAAYDQVTSSYYDAAGRIASRYDAMGEATTYTYNGAGEVLTHRAGSGAPGSMAYDAAGHVTDEVDATGSYTQYSYDAKGNVTKVTDAALSILLGNSDDLVFGDGYYIAMRKRMGMVDANGNGKPAGTLTAADKTKLTAMVTVVTYYDNADRAVCSVDKEGYVTKFTYDALGHVASSTLYATKLTGSAWPVDPAVQPTVTANAALDRTTSYFYYNAGRLDHVIDAEGFTTYYAYDTAGRCTQTQRVVSLVPATSATSYNYYDKAGNKVWQLTAEGYLTKLDYDANGRVITRTAYDTKITAPGTGLPTPAVGDTFHVVSYAYDKAGRVSRETHQTTSLAASQIFTDYTYNTSGQELTRTEAVGSADQRVTTSAYDAAGRLTDVTDAVGVVTHYAFDAKGNVRVRYEAWGAAEQRATYYEYDANRRVISEINALGVRTATAYDASGNVGEILRAVGTADVQIEMYGHDASGHLVSDTNVLSAETTTFTYDAAGNRVSATNANFLALISLDNADYLIGGNGNPGPATDYYLQWRKRLGIVDVNGNGKPASTLTASDIDLIRQRCTVTYAYDRVNNLKSGTDDLGTVATYTYDGLGNKLSATQATGVVGQQRVTTYTYDKDGNLKTVTGPRASVSDAALEVTTYTYDVLGNAKTIVDAKGGVRTNTYDLMGNLTVSTYGGATAANGDTKIVNTYDARGNVLTATTSFRDGTDARTTSYQYDAMDRKVVVTDGEGFNTTIVYDKFGNQTWVQVGTYIPNWVPGFNGTYGSRAVDGFVTFFKYDAMNQLTSMTDAVGNITTYQYDKRGNKTIVEEASNGMAGTLPRTTFYTYDGSDRVKRMATNGGSITNYTYDKVGNKIAENRLQSNAWQNSNVDAAQVQSWYGTSAVYQKVRDILGPLSGMSGGEYINNLPGSLANTVSTTVSSQPYYNVPASSTWASLATTLYGDAAFAGALQQAMGSPLLFTGLRLYNVPAKLDRWDTGATPPQWASGYLNSGLLSTTDTQNVTTVYDLNFGTTSSTDIWTTDTYEYDVNGNLTGQLDPVGARTLNKYDLMGNRIETTSAFNSQDARTVKMEYDLDNRKTADVDALGARTSYSYDKLGNRIKVTNPLGKVAHYYFDAQNMLAMVVDPEGWVSTFQFDSAGNRTRETAIWTRYTGTINADDLTPPTPTTGGSDRIVKLAYDKANRLFSQTDADGTRTDTRYDGVGHKMQEALYANAAYYSIGGTVPSWQTLASTLYGVNSAAAGTALQTAMGSPTLVVNSKLAGLPASITVAGTPPLTYYLNFAATSGGARLQTYTYDVDGRVATFTDADTSVTTFTYDAVNNILSETITSSAALEPDPANRTRKTVFGYNLNNLRTQEALLDPADNTRMVAGSSTLYDTAGNVMRRTDGSSSLAGAAVTDIASVTTVYSYDACNRLVGTTQVDLYGMYVSGGTSYQYDLVGNRILMTDANGMYTRYAYDANNRLVREVKPFAETFTVQAGQRTAAPTTVTTYDAAGNPVEVTTGSQTDQPHTVDITSSNVGTTGTTNLAFTVKLPPIEVSNMSAAGLRLASRVAGTTGAFTDIAIPGTATPGTYTTGNVVFAVGSYEIKIYYVDKQGREVTVEQGPIATSVAVRTGPLASSFTADYKSTRYFDGDGRLLKEISGDNALTVYTYDMAGEVLTKTLYMTPMTPADHNPAVSPSPPGGVSRLTTYSYDLAGRLKTTTLPSVTVTTLANTSGSTPTSSTASVALTETRNYDVYGDEVETFDRQGNRAVSYYDKMHRKVAMMDALGYLVEWDYDEQGNKIAQRTFTQKIASPGSVTPSVRPTAPTAPAGEETVYLSNWYYDAASRLVKEVGPQIAVLDPASPGTGTAPTTTLVRPTTTYAYDTHGNMRWKISGAGTPAEAIEFWSYDGLGRQDGYVDKNGAVQGFLYDAVGNLTSRTRYFGTIPGATVAGKIAAMSGANYTSFAFLFYWGVQQSEGYDPLLNATQTFTYNGLNQVQTQTDGMRPDTTADDLTQVYMYDAAGNRTFMKNEDQWVTTTGYNARGLVTESSSAQLYSNGQAVPTDITTGSYMQYDLAGNVTLAYTGKTANAAIAASGLAASLTSQGVSVSWSAAGGTAQSWVVYGNASHIGSISVPFAAGDLALYGSTSAVRTGTGALSTSLGNPADGTTLYYRVVTQDAAGNIAWTAEQTMASPLRFTALAIDQPTATSMTITATFDNGVSVPQFLYGAAGLASPTVVNFVQQGTSTTWIATISSISSPGTLSYAVRWTAAGKTYTGAETRFARASDPVGISSTIGAVANGALFDMSIATALPTAWVTSNAVTQVQAAWRVYGSGTGYSAVAVNAGTAASGLTNYSLTLPQLAAGNYEVVLLAVKTNGSTVTLDNIYYTVGSTSVLSTQQSASWSVPTGMPQQLVILNGQEPAFNSQNGRLLVDAFPALANGTSQTYIAMYGTTGAAHTGTVTSATPAGPTSSVSVSLTFNPAETTAIAAGTGGLHLGWRAAGTGAFTDIGPISVNATTNVATTTIPTALTTSAAYDLKLYYKNSAGQEVVVEWSRIYPSTASTAMNGNAIVVLAKESGTIARDASGVFSQTPDVYNGAAGVSAMLAGLSLVPGATAGSTNGAGTASTDGQSTGYFSETSYDALDHKFQSNERDGLYRQFGVDANGAVVETRLYGTIKPGTAGANTTPIVSYTQVDSRGRATKQFDAFVTVGGVSVRPITVSSYDVLDRVISTQGPSATAATTYAYNAMGDRIKEVNTVGGVTQTKRTFIDQFGNVTAVITPGGAVASSGYASGYETLSFYDAMGHLVKEVDPNGNVKTYQYDVFGRKVAETDGRGQTTLAGTHTTTTASNNTTPFTSGTSAVAALTVGTVLSAAEKASINTNAAVGLTGLRLKYRWFPTGIYPSPYTDVAVPNTTGTTFSVTLPTQTVGSYDIKLYYFDAQGREIVVDQRSVTTTAATSTGPAVSSSMAGDYTTRYIYDQRNRLVAVQQAQGWHLAHDNAQAYKDERTRLGYPPLAENLSATQVTTLIALYTTVFGYDGRNDRTQTIANGALSGANSTQTTTQTYDGMGRVTDTARVVNGAGTNQHVSYDAYGNAIGQTDEMGRVKSSAYGAFARLAQATDEDGNVVAYTYNDLGQMTREYSLLDNGATKDIAHTYDNAGRMLTIVDARTGVSTTYTYRADGLRATEVVTTPGGLHNRNIAYTYDNLGRMTRWVDSASPAGGAHMNYEYDADGNRTRAYTDTGWNPLAESIGGNANWRKYDHIYTFDAGGRLLKEVDRKTSSTGVNTDTTLAQYTYDAAGNRKTYLDANGATWNYSYASDGSSGVDANNRITQAIATIGGVANTQSWTFDGRGNVLVNSLIVGSTVQYRTTNSQYDEADRAHQTVSEKNGESTSTSVMTYDNSGRLANMALTQDGHTYNYVYTYYGDGRQDKVTVSGSTNGSSTSSYDGNKELSSVNLGQGTGLDRAETRTFVNDNQGHILYQDHDTGKNSDPAHEKREFMFAGDNPMGEIGLNTNNAKWIVMDGADSISSHTYALTSDSNSTYQAAGKTQVRNFPAANVTYTVRAGDTLQSIAGGIYGNPSLWFAIANANGLSAGPLKEGTVIKLPNTTQQGRITADNHAVYNEGAVSGSSLPNLTSPPPPSSNKCAIIAAVIVLVVIAVVAAVVTAGIAAPASAALVGAAASIGVSGAIAATAITIGTFVVVGAAVAAAASILKQEIFVAAKWQDKSDSFLGIEWGWKGVGGDAFIGGLSGAVQGLGFVASGASAVGQVGTAAANWMTVAGAVVGASQGVLSNVIHGGKVASWSSLLGAATGALSGASSVAKDAARGAKAYEAATRAGATGGDLDEAVKAAQQLGSVADVLGKVNLVSNFVTPWAQLAVSYAENKDHKLAPSDWVSAVGGTFSAATTLAASVTGGSPQDGTLSQKLQGQAMQFGGTLLAVGAIGMYMRGRGQSLEPLKEYAARSVGKEIGTVGATLLVAGVQAGVQALFHPQSSAQYRMNQGLSNRGGYEGGQVGETDMYNSDGSAKDAYADAYRLTALSSAVQQSKDERWGQMLADNSGLMLTDSAGKSLPWQPGLVVTDGHFGWDAGVLGNFEITGTNGEPEPEPAEEGGWLSNAMATNGSPTDAPTPEIGGAERFLFGSGGWANYSLADDFANTFGAINHGLGQFELGVYNMFRHPYDTAEHTFGPVVKVLSDLSMLDTNMSWSSQFNNLGEDTARAAVSLPTPLAVTYGAAKLTDDVQHGRANGYDVISGMTTLAAGALTGKVVGNAYSAFRGSRPGPAIAPPGPLAAPALADEALADTWTDYQVSGSGTHMGKINGGQSFNWTREQLGEVFEQAQYFNRLGLNNSEIPLQWYSPDWRGGASGGRSLVSGGEPVMPPIAVVSATGAQSRTVLTAFLQNRMNVIAHVRGDPASYFHEWKLRDTDGSSLLTGQVNAQTPGLTVVNDLAAIPKGARIFSGYPSHILKDIYKPGSVLTDPTQQYSVYHIVNGIPHVVGDLQSANPGANMYRVISDMASAVDGNLLDIKAPDKPFHILNNPHNQILPSMFGDQRLVTLALENDMNSVIGKKLILNAGANGPAVAFQEKMGQLVANREDFLRGTMGEVYDVVTDPVHGAVLPPKATVLDGFLAAMRGGYKDHPTSMGQAFAKGERLENDFINKGVSRMGQEAGVPTPYNDFLGEMVDRFSGARDIKAYPTIDDWRAANQQQILLSRAQAEALMESLKKR